MIEPTEPQARWYAVQAHPNREFLAEGALASVEGVEAYLPTLHVQPVNPRARKARAFFPGYLFVRADLVEVGLSALQWRPGITRLIGPDGEPTPIPDRVIDEIQNRVRAAQAKDPLGLGEGATLNPGDTVRIQSGPLQGYEGMFDTRLGGQRRARILVDFMGRELKTECDVRALEKVERGAQRGPPTKGRHAKGQGARAQGELGETAYALGPAWRLGVEPERDARIRRRAAGVHARFTPRSGFSLARPGVWPYN